MPELDDNPDDDVTTEGDPVETPPEATTFKPITSQEDFEKAITRRINRERNKYKDYEDFKSKAEKYEALEAEKGSDIEKLTRRAEKAERDLAAVTEKLTAAERTSTVRDIADELGLPKALVKRVQGTTEEEIRADIEDLLEGLPKGEKPKGDADDGKKPPSQTPKARMTFTAPGDEADQGLEVSADDILKDLPRGGGVS